LISRVIIRASRSRGILITLVALGLLAGCNRSKPATAAKHYALTGTVVSVDKNTQSAMVDADEVKDFMPAMIMSYKVKNAKDFGALAPGESIYADLIVQGNDYWLENIQVTQRAAAPPPAKADFHIPSPGEEVPDFKLTNQSGKNISLAQYRGKILILTFIYTRCPFPDFCPRVSGQFAELNRQLAANPALYAKTRLLSISFDPKYDTPKVLRDYGHRWAGKADTVFDHWEFAVASANEVPQIAQFFALTVEPDAQGDVITHSLSTAVIGPDGKIVRWYHGSDWQASDLLTDATGATGKL
jgi:protein SCO1/2